MKSIYIALILFFPCFIFAQNVEFDKKSFPDKKSELKAALKSFDMAELYFTNVLGAQYDLALPLYLEANAFNPNNAALNFRIGVCYLNSNEKFKALAYFEKSKSLVTSVDNDLNFFLGRSYQLIREWDKATSAYSIYIKNANPNLDSYNVGLASKRISECNEGKKLEKTPVAVWIDNMGENINSEFAEYGMIINADASELYFTSRRPSTTGGEKDSKGRWFEDIYLSKKVDKKWTTATNIGDPINTNGHDAVVSLSSDGSKMIVYIDDKGDGNLYESFRKGDSWSKLKKMNSDISSPYWESSACYSSDGKKLFFTSDRPLTKKGKGNNIDIYVAHWNAEKKIWDNVERLPENINSPYDEEGVFMHPDGKTLYFSSKGHNTMGGYDIFSTVLQADGTWTDPVNLGYPINTPDDDVFFVVAANGKHAYMTSVRENGFGDKDLYKITFIGEEKKPMLNSEDILLASSGVPVREKVVEPKVFVSKSSMALLKGITFDAKSQKPHEASIELIDNTTGVVLAVFNSDPISGKFMVSLPAGKNYGIAVKSDGYLFHSENFDIPLESDYQEFTKDVYMKKIEVGEVIVLRNIFFDLNKYSLRKESQSELDRLTKLMQDNPTLRIQISGHTDSRGAAALNMELSANRAKEVVSYLVEKGINKSRLESTGFGKDQPLVTDAQIAILKTTKAKEDAHQENRRTEFKIISK
ncbi:MAG: OmpA family protein [Crocinitomicaceae bacterium]|nr:OmpA family protein [Crocinitomicaceae bacterium]